MAMNDNISIYVINSNENTTIEEQRKNRKRDNNFNKRNKKQSLHQDIQFMFWD